MKRMIERNPKQNPGTRPGRWLWGIAAGLTLPVVGFLVTCWSIGAGVHAIGEKALRAHPGDRVEALMALVASEDRGVRDRNRAIWALGQLGDERALAALERYSTEARPSKEDDPSSELSQYELKKAIALCNGKPNVSAFVWRHGTLSAK